MNDLKSIKIKLTLISEYFTKFLCDLLEESKLQKVNLIGIGNSISGGWTAIDNDVCPLIDKLRPFLVNNCLDAGIDINLNSFALIGDNSNEKIYESLLSNPSLKDIKDYFEKIFDSWKEIYNHTLFENCVDKEIALGYYSDSLKRFKDFYRDDELTITNFNGCTGEFLDNSLRNFLNILINNWQFLEDEIDYLNGIIIYLTHLSKNSYITIGNFPYLTHDYVIINRIIATINSKIKEGTKKASSLDKIMYFDGIKLELINHINGKIKIDNHPSVRLQYISLCHYLLFLMMNLPTKMNLKNGESLRNKYVKKIGAIDGIRPL